MTSAQPLTLKTLLGDAPRAAALRSGEVSSPLVSFKFADVKPVTDGFADFVRTQKFDFGELAIVTFLQAKLAGKPLVLLPAVIVALPQHEALQYNSERGALRPEDLRAGSRIGVRAYTQTTGVWVRGILEEDHGVDVAALDWVCFQEPHLAEYREPPFVRRAAPDKTMLQMLLDGELDAAIGIGPSAAKHPQLKPMITDPLAAADAWSRRKGITPINHMAVVTEKLARERPDVVRELYRILDASKQARPHAPLGGLDPLPAGIEANRKALEQVIEYAFRQQVISRRPSVDEVFDDLARSLRL